MTVTFDEYDAMLEKLKLLDTETMYPDVDEIDLLNGDDPEQVWYAVYLYECGRKPANKQEQYSRKNLMQFISEHLTLVDPQTDAEGQEKTTNNQSV